MAGLPNIAQFPIIDESEDPILYRELLDIHNALEWLASNTVIITPVDPGNPGEGDDVYTKEEADNLFASKCGPDYTGLEYQTIYGGIAT